MCGNGDETLIAAGTRSAMQECDGVTPAITSEFVPRRIDERLRFVGAVKRDCGGRAFKPNAHLLALEMLKVINDSEHCREYVDHHDGDNQHANEQSKKTTNNARENPFLRRIGW